VGFALGEEVKKCSNAAVRAGNVVRREIGKKEGRTRNLLLQRQTKQQKEKKKFWSKAGSGHRLQGGERYKSEE